MKSRHQKLVESFMKKAGQDVPEKPTIPSKEVRLLRAKLILEEALETIWALGIDDILVKGGKLSSVGDCEFFCCGYVDILGVIDGCCDLNVVSTGTLSAFGIPDEPMQLLVDRANLRKFSEGSYRRDDGKWMKPPDWEPPEPKIAVLLWKWGYK